jgi:hypothetical protein
MPSTRTGDTVAGVGVKGVFGFQHRMVNREACVHALALAQRNSSARPGTAKLAGRPPLVATEYKLDDEGNVTQCVRNGDTQPRPPHTL